MISRLTLATVLVLLAAACGGGGDSYSVDETQTAFEANGYVLVDPAADPSGSALDVWESEEVTVLVPENGASFFVFIGDADAAEDLWTQYDADGSPTFDESRGNVRVMAESDLDPADEESVQSALDALSG